MKRLLPQLKYLLCLLTITWVVLTALSCEQTVREPGEAEHGGPFLHSEIQQPATR